MKLESLNCNKCGAPLQVPAGVNHLTCNHCGTPLVVRRTESISYTEKLAEVEVAESAAQSETGTDGTTTTVQ